MTHSTNPESVNRQMLEALMFLTRSAANLAEVYDAMGSPRGPTRILVDDALGNARAAIASAEQAQTTDEVFRNECAQSAKEA